MSRERLGYRETLEDILTFTGGKRMLSLKDVKTYTGLKNDMALKNRYPFNGGYIMAPVLAAYMAKGEVQC